MPLVGGATPVLARYYDPRTGQCFTVDPKVSSNLSPYGYVAGDPINDTDPSGEWGLPGWATSAWNATGGRAVHAVQHSGLCWRNPLGGDNGNGGCQAPLSTTEGGLALGAISILATGGVAALPERGGAAAAIGWVGIGSGALAVGGDAGPCLHGNVEACFAAGLGTVGGLGGLAGTLGLGGGAFANLFASASIVGGVAGFVIDVVHAFQRALEGCK